MMDILVIRVVNDLIKLVLVGNSHISHRIAQHSHSITSMELHSLESFVRDLVLVNDVDAVPTNDVLLATWHDNHASGYSSDLSSFLREWRI